MKYYVKNAGKTYGPVEENVIRRKIADGFFSRECLVSVDRNEWSKPRMEARPAMVQMPRNVLQNPDAAANSNPECAPAVGVPDGVPLLKPLNYQDDTARGDRARAKWLIVGIIILLLILIAIAVLTVDACMERRLTYWIFDLFE